jgi:hypothetical protein
MAPVAIFKHMAGCHADLERNVGGHRVTIRLPAYAVRSEKLPCHVPNLAHLLRNTTGRQPLRPNLKPVLSSLVVYYSPPIKSKKLKQLHAS